MKYLIGHKIVYLLFIVANLVLDTNSLSKTENINTTVFMIKSFVLMLLNYILLKNMLNKSLGPTLFGIEQILCVCRILMDLMAAILQEAIIFFVVPLSPVMSSFWVPLVILQSDHTVPIPVITFFALFLLIIEVVYFHLLSRNENRLMKKILTPQKEQ